MRTTLKILANTCILFALVFTSCKKDDLAEAVIPESITESSTAAAQNGNDGADGTNGANGSNGNDGTDGEDGQDGANGMNGEDGQDGRDGVDGTDGEDGADGNANVIASEWIETDFGLTPITSKFFDISNNI